MTGIDEYYKLPDKKRWLRNDNPHEIGGRSTYVAQVAYSLRHAVREAYPINEVPDVIAQMVEETVKACERAERHIDELIGVVSRDKAQE